MTASAPRKFAFDTVFDTGGKIAYEPPRPKVFTEAEVEQLTQEAYRQGEQSSLARSEAAVAAAMQQLAMAARVGLAHLSQTAHDHRTSAAHLALACGRKIADAAMDKFPEAAAAAAVEALSREIEHTPRLVVRVHPALLERFSTAVQTVADNIGYTGQIIAKDDADMAPAAFLLDWGDGRAVFDPERTAALVEEALNAALAAITLHAD